MALPAAIEDGEVARVTHAGLHQLVAGTHQVSGRLLAPLSLREGLVASLESPRSSGEHLLPAFFSGMGNLHWVYFPIFRELTQEETLRAGQIILNAKTPKEVKIKVERPTILRILSDASFKDAAAADANARGYLESRARAEAWALTWFLLEKKLSEYFKFLHELDRMPRDFELKPELVEEAFARAFGIQSAADPRKADPAKLKELETAWLEELKIKYLPVKNPFKSP
jgi:hypothetical protein